MNKIWSPIIDGLSLSGLELWLINKVAFELKYIKELEPVQQWNKNTGAWGVQTPDITWESGIRWKWNWRDRRGSFYIHS